MENNGIKNSVEKDLQEIRKCKKYKTIPINPNKLNKILIKIGRKIQNSIKEVKK